MTNPSQRRKQQRRREQATDPPLPYVPALAPIESPARHPELEQALCSNFDDLQTWAVYGDWLLAQGDPFGELLGFELALLSAGQRDRQRIDGLRRELLARHIRTFGVWYSNAEAISAAFGEGVKVELRLGFLTGLEIWNWPRKPRTRPKGKRPAHLDPLSTTLSSPSARFLRSLRLRNVNWPLLIDILPTLGVRSSLRTLELDNELGYDFHPGNRSRTLYIEPVLEFAPELRTLVVRANELDLGASFACPHLVSLTLSCRELRGPRGSTSLDAHARLFSGEGLPALERLDLHLRGHKLELLELLARSSLLDRLRELSLSLWVIEEDQFDTVGQALLTHAHRFARLESLRVEGIEPSGQRAIHVSPPG